MADKKVTVVVPVYNMEEHVNKSVDSLLNQTYSNYEIILIDDGSTDGSGKICDDLAEKHTMIRTVHKANGGLSSARNRGLEEATGEYIIFPDPDDWVDENYLSALTAQCAEEIDLEICGNYIVTSSSQIVQNTGASASVMPMREAIVTLLTPGAFCGFAWNKLFHMDIIRKNNLRFDEELGMAQDLHFAFLYILCCRKISYNPEPHYFYYQHEAGVTNVNHPLTARKISGLKTYDKLLELAETVVPEAVPIIRSTIANQNLSFLYIYRNTGMCDPEIEKQFCQNFKKNIKYFMKNQHYSVGHKILGAVAAFSPTLYYKLRRSKMR